MSFRRDANVTRLEGITDFGFGMDFYITTHIKLERPIAALTKTTVQLTVCHTSMTYSCIAYVKPRSVVAGISEC